MNGWTAKQDITIDSSLVTTTLTNCPIILTENAFNSDFLDTLQTDCADIRFSSDSDGLVELPREIQYFDRTASEILIHVKIDSLSSSADTTIYAWGGNGTATEPPLRSDSGSQMVWNDVFGGQSYYGVCHLQNGPDSGTLFASDPGFKSGFESSGNWTAINNEGNITQGEGAGKLNNQNSWILSNSDNIINLEAIDTYSGNDTTAFYMEFWIKHTSYPNSNTPIFVGDFNRYIKFDSSGKVKFGDSGNASSKSTTNNVWYHRALMRNDSGNVTFIHNGATDGTTSTTQDLENMNRLFQDRNSTGNGLDGMEIAFLRITRGDTLGTAHLATQYNAVNSAATFATPGTTEITAVGYTLELTNLQTNTEVRVYRTSDGVELAGVEDSTDTFSWTFQHSGDFDVDIHIHNTKYDPIRLC